MSMRALVVLCGLVAVASPALGQNTPIEKLSWMAGCWIRETANGTIEEQWMKPRAGMMLGMGRTVRGGKVSEYEAMRIYESDGALIFAAQPSGQPAGEFTAHSFDTAGVQFENPAHDFPQRVIYRSGGADSLFARVEGTMSGKARGVDFRMKRTSCG